MHHVANPYGARYGGGKRLKVRDFARRFGLFIFPARDDTHCVGEAANIDEAEVKREVQRADNKPGHDEGQRRAAYVDAEEHYFYQRIGDRPECCIYGLVDPITHVLCSSGLLPRLLLPVPELHPPQPPRYASRH